MAKKGFYSFIIVLFSLVIICSETSEAKIAIVAKISGISGQVNVRKAGETAWKAAEEGMELRAGDSIQSGAGSSCLLKWMQGNSVKITPLTDLTIEKLEANPSTGVENSLLSLQRGGVNTSAKKMKSKESSFEVKTPTAIAGVRGTSYDIFLDTFGNTFISCFEGEIVVRGFNGQSATVKGGHKTKVPLDGIPTPPEVMTKQEMAPFYAAEASSPAPTLMITQPAGIADANTTPYTIKGRTTPGSSVAVDGKTTDVDDTGAFSVNVALKKGENKFSIVATKNNKSSSTVTVVINYKGSNTQSKLSVTSPFSGYVTNKTTVTVTGTKTGANPVFVNDVEVPGSNNATTFSYVLTLPGEGENYINVKMENAPAIPVIKVVKDTMPPMLNITQPSLQFTVGAGGCTAAGQTISCTIMGNTDSNAKLKINEAPVIVNTDGSFNKSITIGAQDTSITVSAEDPVGNMIMRVLSRKIDLNRIEYLTVSSNSPSIVANGSSTAQIRITGKNFLNEPVNGASVNLSVSSGGALSPNTVQIVNGEAIVTFTSAVGGMSPITATITASSGTGVTASTSILLTPFTPPDWPSN